MVLYCVGAGQKSAGALEIVASITGAPSNAAFKQAVKNFTPAKLQDLRAQFQRMGIA